jgi:hypothetical protein
MLPVVYLGNQEQTLEDLEQWTCYPHFAEVTDSRRVQADGQLYTIAEAFALHPLMIVPKSQ